MKIPLCLSLAALLPVSWASAQAPALTVEDAVAQALANNLSLQIQRLEPQIAEQSVVIEDSAFDIVFSGDASRTYNSQPNLPDTVYDPVTDSLVTVEQSNSVVKRDRLTVSASKQLATGASVTLSTTTSRTSSDASYVLGDQVISAAERHDSTLAARVVQPLLQGAWSGVNLARLRQAQSQLAEERLRLRSRALDVTESVTQRYWALSHAYAQRDLLQSSLEAAQALVNEMEARAERGLATPIDLLQAQALLAERKEAHIQAQNAIADAGDELSQLMGNLLGGTDMWETPAVLPLPRGEVPMVPFATVWPRVLREDLDTQIQEEAIARNDLQRLIDNDARKMRLDAYAEGALVGVSDGSVGRAYGSAIDRDGHEWSAGLQFSIPWGQRDGIARARRADMVLQQAKIYLIELKQDLYKRARNSWRTLDAGNERLKAARAQVEFQDNAYAQAKARYDRGLSSFRDLLEAQRDLDTARMTYIGVLRDLAVAKSALARLDGSLFETLQFSQSQVPGAGAPQE